MSAGCFYSELQIRVMGWSGGVFFVRQNFLNADAGPPAKQKIFPDAEPEDESEQDPDSEKDQGRGAQETGRSGNH